VKGGEFTDNPQSRMIQGELGSKREGRNELAAQPPRRSGTRGLMEKSTVVGCLAVCNCGEHRSFASLSEKTEIQLRGCGEGAVR
jgi:hypothetical protein